MREDRWDTCSECGSPKRKKSKRCAKCSFKHRSGENNSMFGKSVFGIWVSKYGLEEANKRQARQSLKKSNTFAGLWKDPKYREKIITAVTGNERSQEFKDLQRKHAFEQMKDPEQIRMRSESMSNSYETGKIIPQGHKNMYGNKGIWNGIPYMSKCELKRMQLLTRLEINWKRYEVNDFPFRIHYEFGGKKHLYIPDFVIRKDGRVIIEELKIRPKKLNEKETAKKTAAERILRDNSIEYRIVSHDSEI